MINVNIKYLKDKENFTEIIDCILELDSNTFFSIINNETLLEEIQDNFYNLYKKYNYNNSFNEEIILEDFRDEKKLFNHINGVFSSKTQFNNLLYYIIKRTILVNTEDGIEIPLKNIILENFKDNTDITYHDIAKKLKYIYFITAFEDHINNEYSCFNIPLISPYNNFIEIFSRINFDYNDSIFYNKLYHDIIKSIIRSLLVFNKDDFLISYFNNYNLKISNNDVLKDILYLDNTKFINI